MRISIEFDAELWRVRSWWHRFLCKHFGHPEFKAPEGNRMFLLLSIWSDPKVRRCVRCHAPHPDDKPQAYTHTFKFDHDPFVLRETDNAGAE